MAGKRISELTAASVINGTELLPVVQGGETKRATATLIVDSLITAQKGFANGIAPLGGDSKISTSYLPAAVLGGVNYQGTWNANANSPSLADGVGTKGYYYRVSTAGATSLDGITDWKIGDWAIFNGTVWEKVDNTDQVTSVDSMTGAVVLTTSDVGEGSNLYLTTERVQDIVGAMFTDGGGLDWTYDDSGNLIGAVVTITLSQVSDAGSMAAEDTTDYYTTTEVDTILGAYDAREVLINHQTVDYELVLSDSGKYIRMDKASEIVLTVPLFGDVAFPVGTKIYIRQVGVGQVNISPEVGVTINTPETFFTAKQNASAVLINVDEDEWDLEGNLEAA